MIATAEPWETVPGRTPAWTRTYYANPTWTRRIAAEVTVRTSRGRIHWRVLDITGHHDWWGHETYAVIASGTYALIPRAVAVAKRRASRLASQAAYRTAARVQKARLQLALERVAAARALLDATPLADHRTLAARQDNLIQLLAELDAAKRPALALAA